MPAWADKPEGAKAGKKWPKAGASGGGWQHGAAARTSSSWVHVESWLCSTCSSWTWATKTKCRKCGCKKSYAQALVKEDTNTEWQSNWSSQHSEASHEAGELPNAEMEKAKQNIAAELSTIEEALKALPEESEACRPARLDLLEKQAKLKQESMQQRPLGTQLDGVQGALNRANKRLQSAQDCAEEARKAIEIEQAHIAKLNAEKAAIDLEIKKSAGDTCPQDTAELSDQLQSMYKKMQSKPGIAAETLSAARAQMESLLAGLEAVLVNEEAEEQKMDVKTEPVPKGRSLARNHSELTPERDAHAAKKAAVSIASSSAQNSSVLQQMENPIPPDSTAPD